LVEVRTTSERAETHQLRKGLPERRSPHRFLHLRKKSMNKTTDLQKPTKGMLACGSSGTAVPVFEAASDSGFCFSDRVVLMPCIRSTVKSSAPAARGSVGSEDAPNSPAHSSSLFPAIPGFAWVSALGAFLIAGVARIVVLQHCTFCIDSLCHYIGKRPYSSRCSARDSWLMA
jgi:hypothetical protein